MNPKNINPDVTRFFEATKSTRPAYTEPSFSYLAIKDGSDFTIVQGMLFLNLHPAKIPFSHYETENIKAGHYKLSELKLSVEELIAAIMAGALNTPAGQLKFPPNDSGQYSTYFNPFHPIGLQQQNRLTILNITGAGLSRYINQPRLDWELRAAAVPYDNVHELMGEYLLGAINTSGPITIEIAALAAAAIDRTKSKVSGEIATLAVILAKGLEPKHARLGWRVLNQQKMHERNSIEGDKLTWIEVDNLLNGTFEIKVPQGAVVQAIISYGGATQNSYWLIDPTTWPNSYRASYETFDKDLTHLRDLINSAGKGSDARNLEHAVQTIFWMLGFSVLHFAKISEAPDLAAATPKGNLVMVECTVGLLNANSKLSKLYDRSELVKKNLITSGRNDLKVLPVIVTTKLKNEVEHEIIEAEKLGIAVITGEDLQDVLNRTLTVPNPENVFDEAEKEAQEKKAKYSVQASLNLDIK